MVERVVRAALLYTLPGLLNMRDARDGVLHQAVPAIMAENDSQYTQPQDSDDKHGPTMGQVPGDFCRAFALTHILDYKVCRGAQGKQRGCKRQP